jgi:methylmalonyl-CoA/ethylmalonyl-CoA epimerase
LNNNDKIKLVPHHVGISIQNMKDSITWYKEILGFDFLWEKDFPEIKTTIAFLQQGGFRIELFEHHQTQELTEERKHPLTDMQQQGTKHICFETKDLEKLFEQFKEKKVDIVMGPMLSPPKDAMMGFIRDNTGNLIEIIELK